MLQMLFGLLSLESKRERRATVLIVREKINGCCEATLKKGRNYLIMHHYFSSLSSTRMCVDLGKLWKWVAWVLWVVLIYIKQKAHLYSMQFLFRFMSELEILAWKDWREHMKAVSPKLVMKTKALVKRKNFQCSLHIQMSRVQTKQRRRRGRSEW